MQDALKKFFEFLEDEEFEHGAKEFESLEATSLHSFCFNFLSAKHIVETSYEYSKAKSLYQKAANALRDQRDETLQALSAYAQMQGAILKIDRAIYTAYAPLMREAAEELQIKSSSILDLLQECDFASVDAFYTDFIKKVNQDNLYANAIIIVAELYLDRWKKNDNLEQRLQTVQDALSQLEEAGNERLASDLAPHIHVIRRFDEKRGKSGKLFIRNGEVSFYYYATLDYKVREAFNKLLESTNDPYEALYRNQKSLLKTQQLIKEEMTDIWSGLASEEFINTYKFILPAIRIQNFREMESLSADVEIKYYTMGVFELKLSTYIDKEYLQELEDGMSLSALRHLQSLGTPFALDEKITLDRSEESFPFLADFADKCFEQLTSEIFQSLKKESLKEKASLLHFNTEQNRFTLVRINHIVEKLDSVSRRLAPENFQEHYQYKALVMPVREVRSAIDNWIMYDASVADKNIAGLRYNESEWLSLNLYQSVIALLEQPVWVFDQAIESVEVALSILNLLSLSNVEIQAELKSPLDLNIQEKELKDQRALLDIEIENLDDFSLHLKNLLETVEAGSMMTYPDHTLFMEKIFETLDLQKQKKKALLLQDQLKEKRSRFKEKIEKINETVALKQQKFIQFAVSIVSVFFALGSLNDMFEIWTNATWVKSMELADSEGNYRLVLVLFLAIISIVWLVKNYLREKNEE